MNKTRLSNFELLRIISMFMIVLLHFISNKNIMLEPFFSKNYLLGYGIKSFCIVASNLYVLISGYFLIQSNFSFKKLFKLWLSVLFYSYLFAIIFYFFIDSKNIVFSLSKIFILAFPVVSGQYWFVTNYIVLYLLSPFLNKLILTLNKEDYKKLLIILSIIFIFLKSFIPMAYTFDTTGGYGIIWFIILYLFAGYIKLHFTYKINRYVFLVIYLLSSCSLFLSKLLFEYLNQIDVLQSFSNIFSKVTMFLFNYNSLFVFVSSMSLFLFFKDINIKNNTLSTVINNISKTTFGIYLIHENILVREYLWKNMIEINTSANTLTLLIKILFFTALIYFSCSFIEIIRIKLFSLLARMKL